MKNFKISMSLRYKLLFILITLPLVSLGLYLLMAKDLFQKDKVAYVFDSTATVSRSLATQARMELGASYATYRAVVENFDFTAGDFTQAGKDLFAKNPRAQAMILFRRNSEGQYVKMGQIGKETDPAKKFLADEAGAGKLRDMAVQNTLYLQEVMDAPGMTKIAYRLGEKSEANHMVLLALHSADDMMGAFDPTSGSMYASFMVTKAGTMSVGSMSVVETDLPFLQSVLQSKVNEGTAELKLSDGLVYLVSYANVGMGDLMVISRVDKKKALKAVDVLVAKSVLFFIALLASTLLISVFASNKLTSAIRELFDATGKIAAGDFTVRVEPRSQDEVGGLAESFNFMAAEVARLMADTAEKARLEGEMATVRTVQETLFPAAHQVFGPLNIKGHFEPASECGGDWWSYSRIDNKIFIYVGDATGHGAPAALITAAARSAAAVIESMPGITPGKAMTILNQAIQMTSKGSIMMTFFVGAFDLDNNTFTYASASHDPPYFMRRSGEKVTKKDLIPLNDVNGPRLGDQKGHVYDEITMDFQPGDQIFFYTDGILDIQDPAGKKWGERTFLKTVIDSANSPDGVEAKVEHIRKTIEDFRTGSNLIDDVTMVMCEYEKRAA